MYNSHSKNTGLETHEKVLLYVFHHVFFVGMRTRKIFQDLKTVFITQSTQYLVVSMSKFRDFSVLSVTEHAQIVWKLQRQFRKSNHQSLQVEFVLCTGLRHLNSY